MPNCFQLYRKLGDGTASPTPDYLNTEVDAAIAAHMGVEVHPKYWCFDWYHVIGFLIACKNGCDLGSATLRDEVRKWYDDDDSIYRQSVTSGHMTEGERLRLREDMLRILAFLEANYTSNAFVSRHKHD